MPAEIEGVVCKYAEYLPSLRRRSLILHQPDILPGNTYTSINAHDASIFIQATKPRTGVSPFPRPRVQPNPQLPSPNIGQIPRHHNQQASPSHNLNPRNAPIWSGSRAESGPRNQRSSLTLHPPSPPHRLPAPPIGGNSPDPLAASPQLHKFILTSPAPGTL
jgi:hypothetical protein